MLHTIAWRYVNDEKMKGGRKKQSVGTTLVSGKHAAATSEGSSRGRDDRVAGGDAGQLSRSVAAA